MSHLGDDGPVDVILEGGPLDLPSESRLVKAAAADQKIKVLHRGGYEHFERFGDAAESRDGDSVTFRWTMRTRIAE